MEIQDWQMDCKDLEDPPVGAIGFVYLIQFREYESGKRYRYIGKKNLTSTRKRKFGKKEAALVTDKRKKLYEMVTKESDWRTYIGSNKELKRLIKDGTVKFIFREVLEFAWTKKHLTYLELKYQFEYDVLDDDQFLNDNILGKFFDRDAEGWARVRELPF